MGKIKASDDEDSFEKVQEKIFNTHFLWAQLFRHSVHKNIFNLAKEQVVVLKKAKISAKKENGNFADFLRKIDSRKFFGFILGREGDNGGER